MAYYRKNDMCQAEEWVLQPQYFSIYRTGHFDASGCVSNMTAQTEIHLMYSESCRMVC
jgi:hypothetical protein